MSFVSISRNPFRSVLGFLFGYWFRQKWLVVGIIACVAGSTAADVLMPVYAGRIINAVASAPAGNAQAGHDALAALAAIVALGALAIITRFLSISGIVRLTLRAMREMARDAFWRVQRLSSDWHANSFSGSVVRRISRGMWSADLLNDTLLLALLPSCIVLAGSTVLLGLHWPVMGVLVAVASLAYVALASGISLFYVVPAARLSNTWDTRVGGALADAVGCNAVVKAFGTEAREDALLDNVLRKWQRRTHRTWMRSTLDGTVQGIALLVLRVAIMGTALLLWWRGQASAGDLTYVLATSFVIQGYLRDMGVHVTDLQRGVNEMEELVAIQDQALGVADRPDAQPIRIRDGAVTFDGVTFHYGGHRKPLFRDFSLAIRGGERVGLVGHSGSGKTTFVKLVQRLHDVTAGRILIDGQDISAVAQASLRRQIAIVPQEPVLFHRSLAENIAYARPDATEAEIERAARLANAHDFIARLPKGYATLVGERGLKLSGGERQRVALARAFLADAPILILDEATASLDSESEALIQQAMERLMVGRTVIVIAHRLSTVRALDRILVFDRGRVVEEGDHASLVRRPGGIYRRLFERQALGMVEHAKAA